MMTRDLKLPPLLEAKYRQLLGTEREIPLNAFRVEAVFDRILVWQIGLFDSETFGGGSIIIPTNMKARLTEEAPRGIIISAGLSALNILRSNGMDVGHTISFVQLAPYRYFLDENGKNALIILRDGDIIGSEDLRTNIRHGHTRIEDVGFDKFDHRVFADKEPGLPLPEHDQEV